MRHQIKQKKLNRSSSHRRAMLANMACSLILHEQIKTTEVKAKVLRPYVERLVTKARTQTLAARRYIISMIKDKEAAEKLMSTLSARYNTRPGGYTRIVKIGYRHGDIAPIAYIEFVDRDVSAKGADSFRSVTSGDSKQSKEIVNA
jgi:large subunit ribosomal protein L17